MYVKTPLWDFTSLCIYSFNDNVGDVREWLQKMELSLTTEAAVEAESHQGAPDATGELERMENLHKELLARRYGRAHVIFAVQHVKCVFSF